MTSRNLFFKLQKEDLKRRIWTIALAVLMFFISLPVITALRIGSYGTQESKEDILEQIVAFMGPQNSLLVLITIVGAIICGISGFFYLHSSKKVDLYHSIPVRREELFAVSYINGLLIYLIPYVINVILCFIVLQVNHYMNLELFTTALSTIGINLLFYCFIYTIVVIAVMLTGNFIISCFGTAVFLLYGPLIMMIKDLYCSRFFTTYYVANSLEENIQFLSPIGIYIETLKRTYQGNYRQIIIVLLTTIVLIGFAVFLYKKRPSEAAGKAMAFDFSKPVIKFLLVIPISLGGGILLQNTSYSGSNGWLIFGLIFTLIIVYAVIEIIYNFDIRSAFRYKKQLLACAGITAAITCIFQFDILHFDSYIPKENKIESMSVAFSGLNSNIDYYEMGEDSQYTYNSYRFNRFRYNGFRYYDRSSYQLKHMKLTDFSAAYDLATLAVESTESNFIDWQMFNVKYTLKNGREVYRVYTLPTDKIYELMKEIYANTEFKKAHYPIYELGIEDVDGISCSNMASNKELSLDGDEINQLIELYKEELNNQTLDQLANDYPLATMSIITNSGNWLEYYVYPTFDKSIAFLQDHGFDARKEVDIKAISEIMVNNNQDLYEEKISFDTKETIITEQVLESRSVSYVDVEDMKELLPYLIQRNYYLNNYNLLNVEDDAVDVTVVIKNDEYGNEDYFSCVFEKGMIPDFVKKDIGYNEK